MADFEHNKANLGAATLSSAITSSQTSITVDASDASTFPSTPFYATISPIGETPNLLNAEIVKVTAISSGTLTVTRGQRSTTAKAFAAGSVIFNGVYTQDLDYAQAVGRAFFTASYSAGVFYINNAMLPTTPTDGMSIRVIFSQDVTAGAVGVSLNNGTTYNVYAGAAITSSHGSATTNPQVKSGIIYELVFYNGAWYVMNLPANNSITSDNIDFTTLYNYKACTRVDMTSSATAWANNYPSGWDLTFDTVQNAVYELEVRTNFLGWGQSAEFDLSVDLVSGFSTVAAAGSTLTDSVGIGRIASIIAKATGTSGRFRAAVCLGAASLSFSIYDGYMIARRIR